MSIIHAGVLGAVQGITEFLPISSTAHLNIFSKAFNFPCYGRAIDVFLNFGTLLAIMIFFRRDVWQLIIGMIDFTRRKKSSERDYFILIILASFPAIIVGGIAELIFDIEPNSTLLMAINLILFGIILYVCDNCSEKNSNISRIHAFFVGCAQALAIIPGVSRLGGCLSVARYLKYSRWCAFRFSMILSMPAVAGACFLKLLKVLEGKIIISDWYFIVVGTIFAFVFGVITLNFMKTFLKNHTFKIIAIYRIILGCTILLCNFFLP